MLLLRARVDLEAMAIKEYSTFPKAPALLEPHPQDTRWRSFTPQQRCSRCILQLQPTRPGGACGIMITVVGNGAGEQSSNPYLACLAR